MLIKAKTTREYLSGLHKDRRIALKAVRNVVLKNLPKGYKETTQYGMISYVVPLSLYPEGYLGKKDEPLPYAALASQKTHMAVYLMNIYPGLDKGAGQWFNKALKASGKKMDVGKCCVRFRKLDDLPLDVIGKAIARTSVQAFIKMYEKSRTHMKKN